MIINLTIMNYNFKSEENYQTIQEALSDFDSITVDNIVFSSGLMNWVNLYSDLHLKCIQDRYFNSCIPDFPCEHTEKNIEYEFSMFYYELVEIKNWFELNYECEDILKQLIQSSPSSEEEDSIMSELWSLKNGAYSSFEELVWKDDSEYLKFQMSHFNYDFLNLNKKELTNLHKISEVYGRIEY